MTATGTQSGLLNSALVQTWTLDDDTTEAGYMVKIGPAADEVSLCGAGEEPMGYTFVGTVNDVSGTSIEQHKIGVVGLVPGQKAYIQLLATNAEIAIGDRLETVAGGKLDKKSGAGYCPAIALEAKSSSAGGTIKCLILPQYFAA